MYFIIGIVALLDNIPIDISEPGGVKKQNEHFSECPYQDGSSRNLALRSGVGTAKGLITSLLTDMSLRNGAVTCSATIEAEVMEMLGRSIGFCWAPC